MHLTALDWTIMAAAFAVYLGIGLFVGRTAGKDYDSYFLSGRSMPWWQTSSASSLRLVSVAVRHDHAGR